MQQSRVITAIRLAMELKNLEDKKYLWYLVSDNKVVKSNLKDIVQRISDFPPCRIYCEKNISIPVAKIALEENLGNEKEKAKKKFEEMFKDLGSSEEEKILTEEEAREKFKDLFEQKEKEEQQQKKRQEQHETYVTLTQQREDYRKMHEGDRFFAQWQTRFPSEALHRDWEVAQGGKIWDKKLKKMVPITDEQYEKIKTKFYNAGKIFKFPLTFDQWYDLSSTMPSDRIYFRDLLSSIERKIPELAAKFEEVGYPAKELYPIVEGKEGMLVPILCLIKLS